MYRKFDPKLKCSVITIFSGECFVSNKNDVISTVLGSCIAVCLIDVINNVGGMNHFMLPEDRRVYHMDGTRLKQDVMDDNAMRYGITSMEVLIAEMQKNGASRTNLRAKVFGGGNVISKTTNTESVGDKNIGFARAFLKTEGIPIEKESIGDKFGRKIFFVTGENRVFLKKVTIENALLEEQKYMKKLKHLKSDTDITLF